ncbi:MAG: response regulator transcription factor [Chloroflexota bacterium]|nr:response regulator transcription factor [Chloroflexota bacterium]
MSEQQLRVLLIEDEEQIADFLRRGLSFKGYQVDVAYSGEAGLDAARDNPPDLVLLDVMLPGMSGMEVCARLRDGLDSHLPIIMLTAKDSTEDKIEGLDAGADDYIPKPFSFEELLARIRAALRRRQPQGREMLRVGDLTLNTGAREVMRGDRRVELTTREYDLLEFLVRHAGQVVSREAIFERVWGYTYDIDSDAVKVYISYLRSKLTGAGEPDLIHTVRGIGYVLKHPTPVA